MTAAPSLITAGERDAGRHLMVRSSSGGKGQLVSSPNSCPAAFAVHHHGQRRRVRAFMANSGSRAYGGEPAGYPSGPLLVVDRRPARDVDLLTSPIPTARAQRTLENVRIGVFPVQLAWPATRLILKRQRHYCRLPFRER